MTKKKDAPKDTRWKPGQSANPGGRSPRVGPNGETLAVLIRGRTKELVDRAFEVALNPLTDPKDAFVGIFGLLDRGWGKPKEREDDGSDKPDLAETLAKLIDKLPN